MSRIYSRVPLWQRLWAKIDYESNPTGCWPFQGKGYGAISRGPDLGGGIIHSAARAVMEVILGRRLESSEGAYHRCDNPPCCRPSHLFIADQAANMRDMWAKGRGHRRDSKGSNNPNARLQPEVVIAIRNEHALGLTSQTALARKYGFNQTTISAVVRRRRWAEVE